MTPRSFRPGSPRPTWPFASTSSTARTRTHPHAERIGPLLLPAEAALDAARYARVDERTDGAPLTIGLIARPGSPLDPVREAVDALAGESRVDVTGVEIGWSPQWRLARALGLPLAVEVALGDEQAQALDELARGDESLALAKFRLGPTPTWDWPDERVVAGFLLAVAERGLAFKLTGGMHYAVRGTYAGTPMHGLLNVALATDQALGRDDYASVIATLALRDERELACRIRALTPERITRLRAAFVSYGCCGVLEPLDEVTDLDLLPRPRLSDHCSTPAPTTGDAL